MVMIRSSVALITACSAVAALPIVAEASSSITTTVPMNHELVAGSKQWLSGEIMLRTSSALRP